ncbi:MAG: F0F1 ATP synthase subunit gamma [Candidatus Omnitrophica bacterium]|nr:F0F1 ATP synthase subunit gamma [Candidatus Omnitrophota bacterium]
MQSIQKIKEEMHLNVDMAELMEILKGIAVSEYWALLKKRGRFKRFMDAFNGFFDILDFSSLDHPFARNTGKLAILMITSNEGFMGGLNTRVIEHALAHPEADDAALIMVGEQGAVRLEALKRPFKGFEGIVLDRSYDAARELRNYIVEEVRKGTFQRLLIFYPKSISFMVQRVEELRVLPCAGLFQKRSKASLLEQQRELPPPEEVEGLIIESSLHEMIQYLVETWIVQKLFEIFEESKLAEFSARTVHLEESFQLLQEKGKGIRFQYLRSWHESIDKGMRDIFSAQIIRRKVKRSLNANAVVSGKV